MYTWRNNLYYYTMIVQNLQKLSLSKPFVESDFSPTESCITMLQYNASYTKTTLEENVTGMYCI